MAEWDAEKDALPEDLTKNLNELVKHQLAEFQKSNAPPAVLGGGHLPSLQALSLSRAFFLTPEESQEDFRRAWAMTKEIVADAPNDVQIAVFHRIARVIDDERIRKASSTA